MHVFILWEFIAYQGEAVLSDDFAHALTLLVQDESLSYSLPCVRSIALEYLQRVKYDSYEQFLTAQTVGVSMQNSCTFLLESDELVCTKTCIVKKNVK